jgi:hypothetical protein
MFPQGIVRVHRVQEQDGPTRYLEQFTTDQWTLSPNRFQRMEVKRSRENKGCCTSQDQ